MAAIIEWANSNPGWVAILVFIAGMLASSILWIVKRRSSKPSLKLEVLRGPTLCSSFDGASEGHGVGLHRTAFLVYLKITNFGCVPVQVGDIHLGYRSAGDSDVESFRWLVNETVLLEDFMLPIGDKVKVFPFLKQINTSINTSKKTYLLPGEYENGLVYFEQEASDGLDYPYMDADSHVLSRIRVHDTLGRYWEIETSIVKVMIDAVREHNPTFGLTGEYLAEDT